MRSYNHADSLLYELLHRFAIENKKYPTEAESVLWEHVRANRLGKKFNRQHVIGSYIVDFVCLDAKLIIEVDGGYHAEYEQIQKDEYRTSVLESMGFVVIRFDNEEVIHHIDKVVKNICKFF